MALAHTSPSLASRPADHAPEVSDADMPHSCGARREPSERTHASAGKQTAIPLLVLRHGLTLGNLDRKYIGATDESLCALGWKGIAGFGSTDQVRVVYASPLQRAQQTARAIFVGSRVETVADLREMNFGDFESRSAEELGNDPKLSALYRTWVDGLCEGPCPRGESASLFRKRTLQAFAPIALRHLSTGEPLVVVAHGGTVMTLLSALARPARDYWSWKVGCCQGYLGTLVGAPASDAPLASRSGSDGSPEEPRKRPGAPIRISHPRLIDHVSQLASLRTQG